LIVCPHRPPCPGCPRLGAADIDVDARVQLEALARAASIELRVVRGNDVGFRHRARLAIRGRVGTPKIGIFEAGSHRVVDIPRCLVHHPLVNAVVRDLRRALVETRSSLYSDQAHMGLVRYAQIVVERSSQTAQVVLVTNSDTAAPAEALLRALVEITGPRLHSLFWNGNPARHNAILGPHWRHIAGPDTVVENIGGASVHYPPGAFGQSNLDVADGIVELVRSWVPDHARVAELYAGTGAIGLGLVSRAARVVFNEVSSDSLMGLAEGVKALDPELAARTLIVPGPASASVLDADVDTVIVDPPRKGLDANLLGTLVDVPPSRLLYVACGLPSFLRDAETLMRGSFRLAELASFDLFPHTEHVEVAARFVRSDSPR
jgi:23S rRNA (uracil1939-C5)-methyltransferase